MWCSVTVESPRVAPTPMEVRGAIASYDAATDSYDFYTPNQGTLAMRNELAHAAGIDLKAARAHARRRRRVRRAHRAVSGISGAAVRGQETGRPVKWLSTRTEDFLTDNHGRAISLRGELAFNSKGRFLAMRTEWLCDSGAYLGEAGILTNSLNGLAIGAGVYQVEALYGRHRQIITNTAPTNAYRGAGRPEANLIVERLVDEAALKLKLDPLELRRRNLIKKDQMPYKTLTGIVFDSGDFRDVGRQGARSCRLGRLQGAPPGVEKTKETARHRLRHVRGAVGRRRRAQGTRWRCCSRRTAILSCTT